MFKRMIIPLLLILFMASIVAFSAPVYVNIGPTTELDGDIKILSEIVAEGTSPDGWETTVFFTDPTADNTITVPDADATIGVATSLDPASISGLAADTLAAADVFVFYDDNGADLNKITWDNLLGSVTGVNILDKSATETITANWVWTGEAESRILTINVYSATVTHRSKLRLRKSHQDTVGYEPTVDNEDLGVITVYGVGSDDDSFDEAVQILFEQDGAAGAANIPGRIVFMTATNVAGVSAVLTLASDKSATFTGTVILGANSITMTGSLAATANRVTKGWFTDIESTNDITIGGTALAAIYANLGANTDITSLQNTALYVGRDADNFIGWAVDDSLAIEIGGAAHAIVSITDGAGDNDKLVTQGYVDDIVGGANVALSNLAGVAINTSLLSDAPDTDDLGTVDSEWLTLYLGTYGTIYFGTAQTESIAETNVNELTITATTVVVSGTLAMGANSITVTGSIGVTGSRVTKLWAADLEVTNAIVAPGLVSLANGDITLQPNGTGNTVIYAPSDIVTTKTAIATLIIAEAGTVLVSCAAVPYTITLPTAAGHTGLRYTFIKTDANYHLITLEGDGAETFNYENSTSAPTLTYVRLNTFGAEVTVVSDGTNWQVSNEQIGQAPQCWVYLSASQLNLTDSTAIRIEHDTEEFDIGANFDISEWVSGAADGDVANHLQDDTNSQFTDAMVGKRVKNTSDTTYAYIIGFNDAGDVTLDWDAFPVGNENYEIKHAKFVAPISGKYIVSFSAQLEAGSITIDQRYITILRKDNTSIIQVNAAPHSQIFVNLGASVTVAVSKDEYLEHFFYSAAGVDTLDLSGGANQYTYMQIRLVSKD